MKPSVFELLLIVGASLRLTRLAVVDTIANYPRDLMRAAGQRAAGSRGLIWADNLVSCPHCIGFWITLTVTYSWWAAGSTTVWLLVALTLTVSYLVGHIVAATDMEN